MPSESCQPTVLAIVRYALLKNWATSYALDQTPPTTLSHTMTSIHKRRSLEQRSQEDPRRVKSDGWYHSLGLMNIIRVPVSIVSCWFEAILTPLAIKNSWLELWNLLCITLYTTIERTRLVNSNCQGWHLEVETPLFMSSACLQFKLCKSHEFQTIRGEPIFSGQQKAAFS